MDLNSANMLVSAAVLMGITHAFDADHLAAVAGFSTAKAGRRHSIRYSLHWAVGHGLTLLVLALMVYLLGLRISPEVSQVAEALVGIVLITMGVWLLKSIHRYLSSGTARVAEQEFIKPGHKPLAIGGLHGMAGSAPVLLVFLVDNGSPLLGVGLVMAFIAGVCLAMIGVGLMLGLFVERVTILAPIAMQYVRALFGGLSILIGGVMLYGTL